jgi:hypothetical protein
MWDSDPAIAEQQRRSGASFPVAVVSFLDLILHPQLVRRRRSVAD